MALSIDHSGKKALVTGVTSGLGAGIAKVLAEAGCDVIGCGRRSESDPAAQAFLTNVEAYSQKAVYVQADITKREDIEQLTQTAQEAFQRLDIVVSNAGGNLFRGVDACNEELWEYNDSLNLRGHWRLAKLAKPLLDSAEAPVMLIITSNHAYTTIPRSFPYNVAKAGLVALVKSLALEWGPHCRVVGIAPGYIETEATWRSLNRAPDPQAALQRLERLHPVCRLGSVEEVGGLCAFLASPYARFFTGNTVLMDGGRSALMEDKPFGEAS